MLLGVTYKKNIADQRESPAIPLADELTRRGANIQFIDPRVPDWKIESGVLQSESNWDSAIHNSDIVVLLQAHDEFDVELISQNARAFLDTSGSVKDHRFRL